MEALKGFYKIGSIIDLGNFKLKVVEGSGCSSCCLSDGALATRAGYRCCDVLCTADRREDYKSVKFVEYKEAQNIFKYKQGDKVVAQNAVFEVFRPVVLNGVNYYSMLGGSTFAEQNILGYAPVFGEVWYLKSNRTGNEYLFLSKSDDSRITLRFTSMNVKSNYVFDDVGGVICDNQAVGIIRPATKEERTTFLNGMIDKGAFFNGETLIDVPKLDGTPRIVRITTKWGAIYSCLATSYGFNDKGEMYIKGHGHTCVSGQKQGTISAQMDENNLLFSASDLLSITDGGDTDRQALEDLFTKYQFRLGLDTLGVISVGDVALLHDGDRSRGILSVVRKIHAGVYQATNGVIYRFADKVESLDEYKQIVK